MKYLKHLFIFVLVLLTSFTLVACGKPNSNDNPLTNDYSPSEILIAYFSCTNHTE